MISSSTCATAGVSKGAQPSGEAFRDAGAPRRRRRQGAITDDLLEIVAGCESVRAAD
jgi:hypothetical protein